MKPLLIFILSLFLTFNAFGQQPKSKNLGDTIVLPADQIHLMKVVWLGKFGPDFPDNCYSDSKPHVFNSKKKVDTYYKCNIDTIIDFSKQTVLHYPPISTNRINRVVRRVKTIGNKIIVEIIVVMPAPCKNCVYSMVGAIIPNELIIPKICEGCQVIFKYSETTEDKFDKE